MCAAMSLRDFIRATTKYLQVANQVKSAQGARNEEEEELVVNKKSKKSSRESRKEEGAQKWSRKERARKTVHEEERQEETADVGEPLLRQMEGERPEEEIKLSATPSARVVRVTTVPPVNVEAVKESPTQAGPSATPVMYQLEWENIFEDTMLNSPLLQAKWVARALSRPN